MVYMASSSAIRAGLSTHWRGSTKGTQRSAAVQGAGRPASLSLADTSANVLALATRVLPLKTLLHSFMNLPSCRDSSPWYCTAEWTSRGLPPPRMMSTSRSAAASCAASPISCPASSPFAGSTVYGLRMTAVRLSRPTVTISRLVGSESMGSANSRMAYSGAYWLTFTSNCRINTCCSMRGKLPLRSCPSTPAKVRFSHFSRWSAVFAFAKRLRKVDTHCPRQLTAEVRTERSLSAFFSVSPRGLRAANRPVYSPRSCFCRLSMTQLTSFSNTSSLDRHSSCACRGMATAACLLPLAAQLATLDRSVVTAWYHASNTTKSTCPRGSDLGSSLATLCARMDVTISASACCTWLLRTAAVCCSGLNFLSTSMDRWISVLVRKDSLT
mmetsp:Transcript_8185/g.24318  ORF Transcript_8185/g.24318 Transcript_8185/m.24318 type:complete len:384 (-) Transcript_8185:969-2120(-)